MMIDENKTGRIPLIERYRQYLPITESTPIIALYEGDTPLIPAPRLARAIDPKINLYLKFEGLNPTGSFKDRGMTVTISKAAEENANIVICASTGNTAASAAAYAAKAAIICAVILPRGEIALGKISQSLMHGARIVAVDGNFDDALKVTRELNEKYNVTLVNSINPYRIEGQKTGAFEVCDALGDAPMYHAVPIGNAGNITAYWKGYKEYHADGKTTQLPKMLGFQAADAAPIVKGHIIDEPKTFATAIRIGNPAGWQTALQARDESGGIIDSVTDDEILKAYKMVASLEGIFCEPASAASIAGIRKLAALDYFTEESTIVCVLTGHGLKDPNSALNVSPTIIEVPPTASRIAKELRL